MATAEFIPDSCENRECDISELQRLLDKECDYKLPDKIMHEFLSCGVWHHYDFDEVITETGKYDPNCYIVGSGIIRYVHFNGDKEVTSCFGTPGTMFMSYHSYLFRKGAYYDVLACCPTDLLIVSSEYVNAMIEKSHSFTQWMLRMALTQLYLFDRKNSVINGNAMERYQALVKNRPEIISKVPLKIIASYLEITPQYLSVLRR